MWTDPHAAFDHFLNPYVSIPLLLVILLLAAPFVVCRLRLAGLPDIGEPFDLGAAGTIEIDPADNAFTGYEFAHGLFVPCEPEDPELEPDQGWAESPENVWQWVRSNRPALAHFRLASQASDALFQQPQAFSPDTCDAFSALAAKLRDFLRLSRLEASRQQAENDTAGAWETLLAVFRASRQFGRHGSLLERMVGLALHASCFRGMLLWSQNPEVTASQLHAALQDLRRADAMTPLNRAVVQVEYFYFSSVLKDPAAVFPMVTTLASLRAAVDEYAPVANRENEATFAFWLLQRGLEKPLALLAKLGNFGLYLLGEPELSRRLGQHMYANALSQCDRPFANRTRFDGLFEPDPALPAEGRALRFQDLQSFNYRISCAAILGTPLGMLLSNADRERVRQAVLEVGLALQAHYREHAEFPASLTELIPADLPRLPDDPFAPPGTSLKYRREGGRATLWSIGPDGIDDDGRVVSAFGSEPGDIPTEILAPGESPSR